MQHAEELPEDGGWDTGREAENCQNLTRPRPQALGLKNLKDTPQELNLGPLQRDQSLLPSNLRGPIGMPRNGGSSC